MTARQPPFDKLHMGCGSVTPAGWLNVDGSYGAWLARRPWLRAALARLRLVPAHVAQAKWNPDIFIHDLTRPLPFADDSFAAAYSSHTLEHLYLTDTQALLREVFRVLKPGGVARMVVPDLRAWVDDYLGVRSVEWPPEDFDPPTAADRLNRNLLLRTHRRPQASWLRRMLGSKGDLHSHKWMYDADSLAFHMRDAGFTEVERRDCLVSRMSDVGAVEKAQRIEDGQGVAVEGVKPSP